MIEIPENIIEIEVPILNLKYVAESFSKVLQFPSTSSHEKFNCLESDDLRFSILSNIMGPVKYALKNMLQYINFPDGRIDWMVSSTVIGALSCIKWKPDVIYSICNPQSNVIVGLLLSKIFRVPLILEYKDAWTIDEYLMKKKSKAYMRLSKSLESNALNRATVLIGVTEGLIQAYKSNYIETIGKWKIIPHGYDRELFCNMEKDFSDWKPPLTIVYAATNLSGMSYSIDCFLKALKIANENENKFFLRCYGNPGHSESLARKIGLTSSDIEFNRFADKSTVIMAYRDADVLLMILNKGSWNEKKCTSKLFDLLGARRPILACVPYQSEAAKLIRKLKVGSITENEDIKNTVIKLNEFYNKFQSKTICHYYDLRIKSDFERESMVNKLADAIHIAVCDQRHCY